MKTEQKQNLQSFVSSFIRCIIESAVVEYEQLDKERKLKRKNKEHPKILNLLKECQFRTSKLLEQMYLTQIRDAATFLQDAPYLRPNDVIAQRCAIQPSIENPNLYAKEPEAPIVNTTLSQFLIHTTDPTGTYCHFYQNKYLDSNEACEATNAENKYTTDYTFKDGKYDAGDSEEHIILQTSAKPAAQLKLKSKLDKIIKFFTCCISKNKR